VSEAVADDPTTWRCYRHPDREGAVKCRRCERPICTQDMIQAPVGFQCPECVRGTGTVVKTMRDVRRGSRPLVTTSIIAVCALLFLPTMAGGGTVGRGSSDLVRDLGLYGPLVADGEWYRVFTSAFLHAGLIHIGFNMLLLWQLGNMLEPALGRVRFGLVAFTALVSASLGVLLLSPDSLTVGASGIVFGLMGAAFLSMRARGVDPMQSGIGGLIVINLLLTFAIPGISIGGHLGGLAGGAVAGWLLFDKPPQMIGVVVALAAAVTAACYVVA
jgi:membrane associated rhomboid family serine protease